MEQQKSLTNELKKEEIITENETESDREEKPSVAEVNDTNSSYLTENMQLIEPTAEETILNMGPERRYVAYRSKFFERNEQNDLCETIVYGTMTSETITEYEKKSVAQENNLNLSFDKEHMHQTKPAEKSVRSGRTFLAYRNQFFTRNEDKDLCETIIYGTLEPDTETINKRKIDLKEDPPFAQTNYVNRNLTGKYTVSNTTKTREEVIEQIVRKVAAMVAKQGNSYIAFCTRYYSFNAQNEVEEQIFYGTDGAAPGPFQMCSNVSNLTGPGNIRNCDVMVELEQLKAKIKSKKTAKEVALIKILKEWTRECLKQKYYLNSAFITKAAYEIIEYLDFPNFSVTTWWIKKFMKKYNFMHLEVTENFDPYLFSLIHITVERIIAKVECTLPIEARQKMHYDYLLKTNMNKREAITKRRYDYRTKLNYRMNKKPKMNCDEIKESNLIINIE